MIVVKGSIYMQENDMILDQLFFDSLRYSYNLSYRISSYSCRGNYSFLNSSSEETIQGRKLYEEIRYVHKYLQIEFQFPPHIHVMNEYYINS